MNILMLTSVYPQDDDKDNIVTPTVKYFCEEWIKQGHKVIVIHNNSYFPKFYYTISENFKEKISSKIGISLPTKSARKPINKVENGVIIHRLPMLKIIPHNSFSNKVMIEQSKKIEEIITLYNFHPDVIMGHWVNPQIELLKYLGELYCAKTSLVFHSDCTRKKIRKFDLIENIKEIGAVGCRNKTYAKYVRNVLDLKKDPFICYSGVPNEEVEKVISNHEINENFNNIFTYVGRLVESKNVDVILNALVNAFPQKDFQFNIIGSGYEEKNIKKLSKKLGVSDNVIFHGQIPRKKIFSILEKSSCFTMVSNGEAFGMVYIEAMLSGCLTIASEDGGIDGVIIDGENGFLVEAGNVVKLTNLYKKIKNMNEKDIKKVRKQGRETAMKFSDSKVAEKYLKDVMEW